MGRPRSRLGAPARSILVAEDRWMRKLAFILPVAALTVCAVLPAAAQRGALTAADYARAEKFMNYNVTPLVYRSGVRGNWLPDDRVWYRVTTESGSVATIVDPV